MCMNSSQNSNDLDSFEFTLSVQRKVTLSLDFWKAIFIKQDTICLPRPTSSQPCRPSPGWPAMNMDCTDSWKSLSSTRCRKSTRGSRREEFRWMMLSFSSCSRIFSVIFWSSTRTGKVTWLSKELQRVKNFSRWMSWEGKSQDTLMESYLTNVQPRIHKDNQTTVYGCDFLAWGSGQRF